MHYLSGRASVLGYEVHHDNHNNGHCDIVIGSQEFKWICEAKLYKGNTYAWKGFRQLATRYLAASDTCSYSSLLLYVTNGERSKRPDIAKLITSWESSIVEYGNKAIKLHNKDLVIGSKKIPVEESIFSNNGFLSRHKHINNSNIECVTYHYFIDLYHVPMDE